MQEWRRFDLAGYVFVAYLPSNETETGWRLTVTAAGETVRDEVIPMLHPPVFGPDVEDVAALDQRVEVLIRELGLE